MQRDAVHVPLPRRSTDELAALWVRHRPALAAQARSFLRDPADVDDVVQEAFVRLLLSLPDLGDEQQVVAYGRRTVRNLCLDRYRSDARRPLQVELDEAADVPVTLPEDPVVRDEEAALVREALRRLTPLHRAALVKREVEEKPLPVVAAELGIPEESAKHLLHRARRALRRLLVGTQLEPGADPEVSFARVVAGSGGRSAAFLLVLVALLGSGPDLRVVPVVGDDLPDLPSVVDLVRPVLPGPAGLSAPEPVGAPAPAVAPAAALPDAPSPAAAVTPSPSGAAVVAAPAVVTSPSPSPAAARRAATPPPATVAPSPSPDASPVVEPSPAGVGPSGTATAEPKADPQTVAPGDGEVGRETVRTEAGPSASSSPSGSPSAAPSPSASP